MTTLSRWDGIFLHGEAARLSACRLHMPLCAYRNGKLHAERPIFGFSMPQNFALFVLRYFLILELKLVR